MMILSIDCTTDILSLALKADDRCFELTIDDGKKHSENLVLLIDSLFVQAGREPRETELVVCSQGPGSFTGLRIGMSTAKAVSMAAACPFVAIPALDVYGSDLAFFDGAVLPVIDARKKRFYTALYHRGERKTDFLDAGPAEILDLLEPYDKVIFTGPDCASFFGIMQKGVYFDKNGRSGKASSLMRLGLQKFQEQGTGDPQESGPLYIRKSDAEEARG
jgi:tRNA threonylcarbamoyladenosine biosynthesis protein TsaB